MMAFCVATVRYHEFTAATNAGGQGLGSEGSASRAAVTALRLQKV